MAGRRMTKAFRQIPMELFRVTNSRNTRLREYGPQRTRSYDVITNAGKVLPKALQPSTYAGPNGASMRPNTQIQQTLVDNFRGSNAIVYVVSAGTSLPESLILVHEGNDHFSLQGTKEMTVQELNDEITSFLERCGRVLSKDQWKQAYPTATMTENLSQIQYTQQTQQQGTASSSSIDWVWDAQRQRYRYWNGQSWCWQS